MRYPLTIAAIAATLGLAAGVVIGWRTAEPKVVSLPEPQPAAKQPPNTTPLEAEPFWAKGTRKHGTFIPLSEIFSTVDQPPMKRVPFGRDEFTEEQGVELKQRLKTVGTPTALVVRATTIHAAIDETLQLLRTGVRLHDVRKAAEDESDQLWAFVFLGNASNGWELKEVVQSGSEIAVHYNDPPLPGAAIASTFIHSYFIPFRAEPRRVISVRLFDLDRNLETLVFRTRQYR